MKTLHLSIIAILALISSISIMTDAFAQNETSTNTNNVEIQNIQVEPSAIKVGDTLKITATLVNNSPDPIFVSDSGSPDCEGPFFTVMFDNHVKIKNNGIACSYVAFIQRLDPGTKTTGTSPGLALVYTATESGTANATVTFSYSDSGIEKTISKSFLFTINDNGTKIKTVNNTVLSPLIQFKSGISPLNVKCATNYVLIIKAEDGSPACVKPNDTVNLMNQGWAINQFIVGINYRNQGISVVESDSGYGKFENGTFSQTMKIYVFINNFTQSSYPLKVQVLHDDILYRTDTIPSTDILSDGFYKYQFTQQGAIFGGYKIIATYGNKTSQTSFGNPIPP